MPTEIELDGKTYRQIKDIWYDGTTFVRVPKAISQQLDLLLTRQEAASAFEPEPKRKRKKRKRSKKKGFKQEEVLPVIASIIENRNGKEEYVTHHEIVEALLQHPEGRKLAEKAVDRRGHSPRRWAGWMVQSFSQHMSSEDSEYDDSFERARVDGAWAYRAL